MILILSFLKVISFAGELLKHADELLRNGLHPAEIVSGYKRAYDKTLELLPKLVVKSVSDIRNREEVSLAIKSVLATKQFGYEEFLSNLVVDAALITFPPTTVSPKLNIDNIRLAKLRGGSINQSSVIKGILFIFSIKFDYLDFC